MGQELAGGEDGDAAELLQGEKVMVATDDVVGAAVHGASEEFIIGRISSDGGHASGDFDLFGIGPHVVLKNAPDFLHGQAEFGIGEDAKIFIKDLRGEEQAAAAVLPGLDQFVQTTARKGRGDQNVGV